MALQQDIIDRIERDFGANADGVFIRCEQLITQSPELFTDRLLRCIIFAAGGDIPRFKHFVDVARHDPRDVIVAGECDHEWRTVRDLSQPFTSECPEDRIKGSKLIIETSESIGHQRNIGSPCLTSSALAVIEQVKEEDVKPLKDIDGDY